MLHVATNIYLMGMAEELERPQLGVKLGECWCRVLMYADDVVLVVDGHSCSLCWMWYRSMCHSGRLSLIVERAKSW